MDNLNEYNEALKRAILEQDEKKELEIYKKRNEFVNLFEQEEKLKLLHEMKTFDESLMRLVEKTTKEIEEYLLMQRAKKRASDKYNEY